MTKPLTCLLKFVFTAVFREMPSQRGSDFESLPTPRGTWFDPLIRSSITITELDWYDSESSVEKQQLVA